VILLVAYIAQLTRSEPKQTKLPLCTYWLLFILTPLLVFGAMFGFSTTMFLIGLVVLLVLTVIGEHGFRLWIRLFGVSR
jgi:predicted membrane metal-binding protein